MDDLGTESCIRFAHLGEEPKANSPHAFSKGCFMRIPSGVAQAVKASRTEDSTKHTRSFARPHHEAKIRDFTQTSGLIGLLPDDLPLESVEKLKILCLRHGSYTTYGSMGLC